MSRFKPESKLTNQRVDWNDPRLSALLSKTEDWKLDNRGVFPATEVQVQIGWGAGGARQALLVWQSERVMVLAAPFLIAQGEHVRVDRADGAGVRSTWAVVAEGRAGTRDEDRLEGIFVHWLHMA
jgi:hypothetical protein